ELVAGFGADGVGILLDALHEVLEFGDIGWEGSHSKSFALTGAELGAAVKGARGFVRRRCRASSYFASDWAGALSGSSGLERCPPRGQSGQIRAFRAGLGRTCGGWDKKP